MSSDLAAYLQEIREKRGYLLPHHGLMAVSMPKLLDAYDALYTELTLKDRVLTKHGHEYVWMAILIASKEAIGTHHIPRYLDAGGSAPEFQSVLAITSLAMGSSSYRFVGEHWQEHLPDVDPFAGYVDAFRAAAEGSDLGLAHMAAAAVFTTLGDWPGLEWQLLAAYADGTDENGLAEALSLTMFPGGVPNFVEAADVWRNVVLSGKVDASPEFRTWAALSGQGGFNEASGIGPQHD